LRLCFRLVQDSWIVSVPVITVREYKMQASRDSGRHLRSTDGETDWRRLLVRVKWKVKQIAELAGCCGGWRKRSNLWSVYCVDGLGPVIRPHCQVGTFFALCLCSPCSYWDGQTVCLYILCVW
jgi:hypothetical protein